ncbi:MAG: helix-turn-helix domain-containing protein [Phycisphaeraceae bacterium]|nr:MAG: helix-turn-helix domain-containing protein [Phycisphaeraceae bacterium]
MRSDTSARPSPTDPALLDLHTAAQRLGLSHRTVWEMAKKGTLPTVRIGRRVLINARALDKWISARTKGGAA